MITVERLRKKAENRYSEVLRSLIRGENPFPILIPYARLRLTGSRTELIQAIEVIRSQSTEQLRHGLTVGWTVVDTQRFGRNKVPGDLTFATSNDFFGYLGKTAEANLTILNARRLIFEWSQAEEWCVRNLRYLTHVESFYDQVVHVVQFFVENPFPERFVRELPLRVSTKFIEENSGLLGSFISCVAPEVLREGEKLEEKLGLKTAASFFEIRVLDARNPSKLIFRHFMATAEELKGFHFSVFHTVVVVENRTTFLTLPQMSGALAILGQGYALHRLQSLPWLADKHLIYWGDLDVEGFEILAGLRKLFGHVEPILMEEETWARYALGLAVNGSGKVGVAVERRSQLTPAELALATRLGASNQRLEQEKIPQNQVEVCFERIGRRE